MKTSRLSFLCLPQARIGLEEDSWKIEVVGFGSEFFGRIWIQLCRGVGSVSVVLPPDSKFKRYQNDANNNNNTAYEVLPFFCVAGNKNWQTIKKANMIQILRFHRNLYGGKYTYVIVNLSGRIRIRFFQPYIDPKQFFWRVGTGSGFEYSFFKGRIWIEAKGEFHELRSWMLLRVEYESRSVFFARIGFWSTPETLLYSV